MRGKELGFFGWFGTENHGWSFAGEDGGVVSGLFFCFRQFVVYLCSIVGYLEDFTFDGLAMVVLFGYFEEKPFIFVFGLGVGEFHGLCIDV